MYRSEALEWQNHEYLCLFSYDQHLASIHNETQNKEAKSICGLTAEDCWFGLNDIGNTGQFSYIDGTDFDFGTDLSGGVSPWTTYGSGNGQPSGNQDCVHILGPQAPDSSKWGWNDPQAIYIIRDNLNYQRIPHQSFALSPFDVLDTIILSFEFMIYSFAATPELSSILTIGVEETQHLPSIYLNPVNKSLVIQFSAVSEDIITETTAL